MKTLKKTLCLVLAVVMAVGVLVLPAAAADTTTAAAATVGKDAYDTLHAVGILKGTNASGDAELGRNLSRSDVVAIMYRLMTADVKDEYTSATVEDAKNFADSASFAKWEKGYIGYGWHHEIVKGKGDGTFAPKDNVTGTELLAMLLRALGYGKQGEFEGTGWSKGVKEEANRLALLKGLTNYDPSKAATRGQAFIMVVNACGNNIVTWDGHKYVDTGKKLVDIKNVETAAAVKANSTVDDFGAPAAGTTASYKIVATCNFPVVPRELTSDEIKGGADAAAKPVYTFYTPMTMCDIITECKKLGVEIKDGTAFTTYTNGAKNVGSIKIEDDTTTTIGAYGRETNIYVYKNGAGADVNSIVFKDVILAKTGAAIAAGSGYTDSGNHASEGSAASMGDSSVWFNTAIIDGLARPNGAVRPGNSAFAGAVNTTKITGPAEKSFFSSYVVTTDNNTTLATDAKLVVKDNAVTAKTITFTEPIFSYTSGTGTSASGETWTWTEQDVVGIRDGNDSYYYSISYVYNNGRTFQKLGPTDIGKTFIVYTDGHNNIIGIDREVGASDTGYGVITGLNSSKAIAGSTSVIPGSGNTQYAIEVTVLTAKNETKTVAVVKDIDSNGKVQGFTSDNEVGFPAPGTLVKWTLVDAANKYYVLTDAAGLTTNPFATFNAGDADAYAADKLVNNTTVFFVAKYSMKNSLGGYSFDGYQVFNGFQADGLCDLSYKYGKIFINGKEDLSATGIEVSYFNNADVNDSDMDYVLINNATQWSTSTQPVPEYAFFKLGVDAGTIVDDNYKFNIFQNGADTTLVVNNDDAKFVTEAGLRILEKDTNGTSKVPSKIVNWVDSENVWSYKDGVITLGTAIELNASGRGDKYLTVDPDAVIYQFNLVNGRVVKTAQTIEQLRLLYGGAFEFFFELDADGYVSTIYAVERQGAAGSTGAPEKLPAVTEITIQQLKTVTVNASTKETYFKALATQADSTKPTASAAVTWYKANETTGKFEVYEGDIFVKGTYYALITVSITDGTLSETAALKATDCTLDSTSKLPEVKTAIFTIG